MKLSAYNRYVFLKKLHKRDLIIIKRKEKYYSFSYDKEILKLIKFTNSFKLLDKYKISYKVIDNLDINVNIETDKNVKVKIRKILDRLFVRPRSGRFIVCFL